MRAHLACGCLFEGHVFTVVKHWCAAQTPVIVVCVPHPKMHVVQLCKTSDKACALLTQPPAFCCNPCMFALGCSGHNFSSVMLVCFCWSGSACPAAAAAAHVLMLCAFLGADTLAVSDQDNTV